MKSSRTFPSSLQSSPPKGIHIRVVRHGNGDTYIEVIIDCQHRHVATCTQTFDFHRGEFPILGGISNVQSSKVLLYSLENLIFPAKYARCRRANLNEVLADRFPTGRACVSCLGTHHISYTPIKRRLKSCDLVHQHRRYLDQFRNIVHDDKLVQPSFWR